MNFLLFFIILVEGYAVLASELIAIRLIIPWVGSGTATVSIVVAAVLMPLAIGYYYGGKYKNICAQNGRVCSVRKKLLFNLKLSMFILTIGLSYVILKVFFEGIYNLGFTNRIGLTFLYVAIFIVYPVFLLGQTVPLVSNYFSSHKLSEITGKILMISTIGSFLGSIVTTIILMTYIGVNNSVIVVIASLALLALLISKKSNYKNLATIFSILLLAIYLNGPWQMKKLNIVNNNAYNTVQITEKGKDKNIRIMALNRGNSSGYIEGKGSPYGYVKYIDEIFIKPLRPPKPPKKILIIGAAGFTMGIFDRYNRYTFIDIDPDLKDIAEEHFLKVKLHKNKKFIPLPARGFLTRVIAENKKFDLVILDTFKAGALIPEHLLTREYFEQVNKVIKDGGFLVINTVTTMNFTGDFSKRLDNTIRAVFPHVTRQIIWGSNNAWLLTNNEQNIHVTNIVYSYYKEPDGYIDHTIYTDNKNPSFMDKKN